MLENTLRNPDLCRVHTITAFISLGKNTADWLSVLQDAKEQCQKLADVLTAQGYTVQTLRMVSNPFGEYLDTMDETTAKQDLAKLTNLLNQINANSQIRFRFAIGEAKTAHEISLLPSLIKDYGDLCNACVNIEVDSNGFLDNEKIKQSVQAIQTIAHTTPNGEGNFNFTINTNCQSYIPYFPASYHRGEQGKVIVLGLETPDLLVASLQNIDKTLDHATFLQQAKTAMQSALQFHVDSIMQVVNSVALADDWQVLGMDTSAAPSKNCSSMVDVYRILDLPYFGSAGTVELSSLLTKVFKGVTGVKQVGFSGLMLAVTEDTGLAQATIDETFDMRALLTYSSVCGIGLDTVPIAGDTPFEKICAIIRDTGTMAYRLGKPLTVRLFPVPNLQIGDMTQFESEDLCNCKVIALP